VNALRPPYLHCFIGSSFGGALASTAVEVSTILSAVSGGGAGCLNSM